MMELELTIMFFIGGLCGWILGFKCAKYAFIKICNDNISGFNAVWRCRR